MRRASFIQPNWLKPFPSLLTSRCNKVMKVCTTTRLLTSYLTKYLHIVLDCNAILSTCSNGPFFAACLFFQSVQQHATHTYVDLTWKLWVKSSWDKKESSKIMCMWNCQKKVTCQLFAFPSFSAGCLHLLKCTENCNRVNIGQCQHHMVSTCQISAFRFFAGCLPLSKCTANCTCTYCLQVYPWVVIFCTPKTNCF